LFSDAELGENLRPWILEKPLTSSPLKSFATYMKDWLLKRLTAPLSRASPLLGRWMQQGLSTRSTFGPKQSGRTARVFVLSTLSKRGGELLIQNERRPSQIRFDQ
jgi:hypothetical protein